MSSSSSRRWAKAILGPRLATALNAKALNATALTATLLLSVTGCASTAIDCHSAGIDEPRALDSRASQSASSTRLRHRPSTNSRPAKNGQPPTFGDHWVHEARERALAAHRPFWHEPHLATELGFDAGQIESFDRAFESAIAERRSKLRLRRSAEQRRNAALATVDWEAAKKANRDLAKALTRLALIDSQLKVEVLSELRDDQLRQLAEFHPGLISGPWLPPEGPNWVP